MGCINEKYDSFGFPLVRILFSNDIYYIIDDGTITEEVATKTFNRYFNMDRLYYTKPIYKLLKCPEGEFPCWVVEPVKNE